VNIIVIFHNGYQLTENIPVNVYRWSLNYEERKLK
jgi:hypothetical protein